MAALPSCMGSYMYKHVRRGWVKEEGASRAGDEERRRWEQKAKEQRQPKLKADGGGKFREKVKENQYGRTEVRGTGTERWNNN